MQPLPQRSRDLWISWTRTVGMARWTAVLTVLALVVGFGVGSRWGASSGGRALEAGSDDAHAVVSDGALPDLGRTARGAFDPLDVAIAVSLGEEHAGADEELDEPFASDEQQDEAGVRYAAMAIDALPMYGEHDDAHADSHVDPHADSHVDPQAPGRADPASIDPLALTLVTRGEIRAGESLGASLRRQGISAATVHRIASEMGEIFDFRRSRPGDRYRLGQDTDGRVLDFRYSQTPEESFYLAWEGTRYVVRKETTELSAQIAKIAGIVDSSFYEAIRALGEQSALASDFVQIFAWDIDFSRNVQPGDEFQILYERLYRRTDEGEEMYVRPGRILAGRYRGSVGEHTVVYFEDESGRGSYFRPDGSSIERAFLAAPLEFRRISSRFTRARHHPILNVTRPHHGIDYAAPQGTPVWAVAKGVVEFKGRAGASGNLIRVRHANGYTSHYAHLAGFAKDLRIGDRVEQKQVIGYVGSTGLSTGPHVCFRVKKRGRYVDPMKISSPPGEPVDRERLPEFEMVRDGLLAGLGARSALSITDEAL